jgi:S1-C subfamily serine protease
MNKKQFFATVFLSVILAVFLQIAFGGYLSARLSTWPVLRGFNLFNPQAPIVITNKEVVRVSDTQDAIDAVNRAKSRLSAVAVLQNNQLTVTGGAANLTSDGYFVSAQAAFNVKGATYFVILNDGQSLPIQSLHLDPATNLVVFKAAANGIGVASLVESKNLVPGQKVVLLSSGLTNFTAKFAQSHVSSSQNDNARVFFSDRVTRNYGVQTTSSLIPGGAIVTLDGAVAGLWDGGAVIASDAIKVASDNFLANKVIRRPSFGFYYRTVTLAESNTLNVPQGFVVTKPDTSTAAIVAGSPAAVAGLQEGDYIIQVNEAKLDGSTSLEEYLEKVKPGDVVSLTLARNRQTLILNVTAGELK